MSEVIYDPTPEQFGVFWKYVDDPDVTDILMVGHYGLQICIQADIRWMRKSPMIF